MKLEKIKWHCLSLSEQAEIKCMFCDSPAINIAASGDESVKFHFLVCGGGDCLMQARAELNAMDIIDLLN